MSKVNVQVSGAAPGLAKVVEFDAQFIADSLQSEISGGKANQSQVDIVTEEFINRYGLKACYASGTFLYFKYNDDAILDELEDAR